MNGLPLFAQGVDLVAKGLAVVGAFALMAFLSGYLLQLVAKVSFNQQVPRWPLWVVRMLCGGVFAWLIAIWLFGGGGGGIGGPGGLGKGGSEKDSTKGKDDKARTKETKDKEGKDKKDQTPATASETLRVEVLGEAPLKKIAGKGTHDPARCYRIPGEGNKLRTLEDVQQLALKRLEAKPPLRRIEIVVYRDSPDLARPQVDDLARWARDLKEREKGRLMVDSLEPDRNAPVD